jgi:hypothetical protein
MSAKFHSALEVRKVGEYKWLVLIDLVFYSAILRGYVVLPAGSIIDFASTPRWLWWLVPKSGQYDYGTALHDGGYKGLLKTGTGRGMNLSRELSDLLMDEANEATGVDNAIRLILLRGVQLFGSKHYDGAHGPKPSTD